MEALTGVTRGRKLLIAVLQVTTAMDVAARCSVYQQRVSDWASGVCKPSAAARAALNRNYGIPENAWDSALISTFGDSVHRRRLS
jgi:hypothetical protein